MNVEIKFMNTVNKTVIEFNYITHNCFLVPSQVALRKMMSD